MGESVEDGLAQAAAEFTRARPRLFGIAYRILGSAAEAEDVVQDAWLRWQNTDRAAVTTPDAFLTTVTTRLAINVGQSARVRRETYVGPWLPEPIATGADPAEGVENTEAIDMAVLFLMERLPPRMRAAYVLREAFDYTYSAIAEMLQLSESNVRQLVSRSRKRLADGGRERVDAADHRRLLEAFLAAAQEGDLSTLEELFARDVVSYSDGGGKAALAARIPVEGRSRVARFVAAFASHFWEGTTTTWIEANGLPAVLICQGDGIKALLTARASTEGLDRIMWVMNPDKLASVTDWTATRSE